MATLEQMAEDYSQASPHDQKLFRQKTGIDLPPGPWQPVIWLVILLVLAGTIFFFGWLGYQRMANGQPAEVLFGLATTALGVYVGILSPSPTNSQQSRT